MCTQHGISCVLLMSSWPNSRKLVVKFQTKTSSKMCVKYKKHASMSYKVRFYELGSKFNMYITIKVGYEIIWIMVGLRLLMWVFGK